VPPVADFAKVCTVLNVVFLKPLGVERSLFGLKPGLREAALYPELMFFVPSLKKRNKLAKRKYPMTPVTNL